MAPTCLETGVSWEPCCDQQQLRTTAPAVVATTGSAAGCATDRAELSITAEPTTDWLARGGRC